MRGISACVAVILALLVPVPPVLAQLQVDVVRGQRQPLPVAIHDFDDLDAGPALRGRGADIARVIRNDLGSSGYFRILDPRLSPQSPETIRPAPHFAGWRSRSVQALASGRILPGQDDRLRVEFRLWDLLQETQILGVAYLSRPENWRRIAHIISDAIHERLTGDEGYFDTRIVFIAESGTALKPVKRLAIMDQDGANLTYLSSGRWLTLTPRFSPARQEIVYMQYRNDRAHVYLLDVDENTPRLVGNFPGIAFAPRFSPDGRKIVLSMASRGNTEIFLHDIAAGTTRRLTFSAGIDTSPDFSPDGRQIVFNSDREGSPQLYVMEADGRHPRRITSGQGRYHTPVWSPRGDLIAFTRAIGGEFAIGVMLADGSDERILSRSFLDEGPGWSPNGRLIVFARRAPGGRTRIMTVNVDGTNLREIPMRIPSASDPSWSPPAPLN